MALAFGAPGGRQHFHIYGGTAQGIIQLIAPVFPLGRHALCDGVIAVADLNGEFVLRPVAASAALAGVADEFAFLIVIDVRAVFFSATTPAAKADHFVVLQPIGEGVVRGVHNHEAAAVFHVFFKIRLHSCGPFLAVIVADNHVVLGECRPPFFPLLGIQLVGGLDGLGALFLVQAAGNARALRGGGYIHGKHFRRFKLGFHPGRHSAPVVIVLPVHNQQLDRLGLRRQCQDGQESEGNKGKNGFFH